MIRLRQHVIRVLQFACIMGALALAQAASAASDTLSGEYRGDINGNPSSLSLHTEGQQLTGQIDAGGYIYQLSGQLVTDNRAEGQFSDPQTGGSGSMAVQRQGESVALSILMPGQYQPVVLHFTAGSAATGGHTVAQPGQAPRDPALVGHWLYTESYSSGGFTGAAQVRMAIYPNGRFEYGDGQFAGGGPGMGGSTGGGGVEVGEWKTSNRIVYVRGAGSPHWQPLARYHVEGYSLMFSFGDGSRQVWKRNG